MNKKIGFFIDDERELVVPPQLSSEDIEWTVFRSTSELRRSELFKTTPASHICFDYYLNAQGSSTGIDAITIVEYVYSGNDWELPTATFHSSDPVCNDNMRKLWIALGGKVLDTPKPVVVTSLSTSTLSNVRKHFRKHKKSKKHQL